MFSDLESTKRVNSKRRRSIILAVLLTAVVTFGFTAVGFVLAEQNKSDNVELTWKKVTESSTQRESLPLNDDDAGQDSGGTGERERIVLEFDYSPGIEEALEKFVEAYNLIQANYFEELTDTELVELMTEGLADSVESPYTMYLSKEENDVIEESMSGEYSGIGATVMQDPNSGQYVISEVLDDSSAMEGGVLIGDVFEFVDGTPASDFRDVSMLAANVRGEPGTVVEIVLYRPSEQKSITFELERRTITNPNIRSRMLTDDIGYIRITEFSFGVNDNFRAAIDALQEQGAQKFVFDLRNNSGGYATECIDMLDYLLPEATIASIKGRSDNEYYEEEWVSHASMGVPDDMTYCILINEYSASASELFSGSLRDLGKATLIGEQSFGKGCGTITYILPDGSAVNITTFLYYLPSNESVEGVGLEPDILIELDAEVRTKPVNQLTDDEDIQLQRAISELEKQLRP